MTTVGIVTLSPEGAVIARRAASALTGATLYVHESVGVAMADAVRFIHVAELTASLFKRHDGIVYIAPCGVAVRAIAPHLEHKLLDPAVVVVDVGGRHAVSLLSGHEGGANRLAVAVANAIGAEPVISTTTEARKTIIVGVGCRKRAPESAIVDAVERHLDRMGLALGQVRLMATADVKRGEPGLLAAADALDVPLVFIPSERIIAFGGAFEASPLVLRSVGLPAVAEPACMLAGKNTVLILRKKRCNGVTIAMARESCMWSA